MTLTAQDADLDDDSAHMVLDMLDSEGNVLAEDVTHVAWTDAGGMSLLAAATRTSIAVFTLHRQSHLYQAFACILQSC